MKIEELFVDGFDRTRLRNTGVGKEDVDLAVLPANLFGMLKASSAVSNGCEHIDSDSAREDGVQ